MGTDCPQIRIYNILASLVSWRIDPFDSLSFVRECVCGYVPAYDDAVSYIYLLNSDEKPMSMANEVE